MVKPKGRYKDPASRSKGVEGEKAAKRKQARSTKKQPRKLASFLVPDTAKSPRTEEREIQDVPQRETKPARSRKPVLSPKEGKEKKSEEKDKSTDKSRSERWKSAIDSKSGRKYFYGSITRTSTWTDPEDFLAACEKQPPVVKYDEEQRDISSPKVLTRKISRDSSKSVSWKEVTDPNTGRLYYYHRVTRKATWTKPKQFESADSKSSTPGSPTLENEEKLSSREEGIRVSNILPNFQSFLEPITKDLPGTNMNFLLSQSTANGDGLKASSSEGKEHEALAVTNSGGASNDEPPKIAAVREQKEIGDRSATSDGVKIPLSDVQESETKQETKRTDGENKDNVTSSLLPKSECKTSSHKDDSHRNYPSCKKKEQSLQDEKDSGSTLMTVEKQSELLLPLDDAMDPAGVTNKEDGLSENKDSKKNDGHNPLLGRDSDSLAALSIEVALEEKQQGSDEGKEHHGGCNEVDKRTKSRPFFQSLRKHQNAEKRGATSLEETSSKTPTTSNVNEEDKSAAHGDPDHQEDSDQLGDLFPSQGLHSKANLADEITTVASDSTSLGFVDVSDLEEHDSDQDSCCREKNHEKLVCIDEVEEDFQDASPKSKTQENGKGVVESGKKAKENRRKKRRFSLKSLRMFKKDKNHGDKAEETKELGSAKKSKDKNEHRQNKTENKNEKLTPNQFSKSSDIAVSDKETQRFSGPSKNSIIGDDDNAVDEGSVGSESVVSSVCSAKSEDSDDESTTSLVWDLCDTGEDRPARVKDHSKKTSKRRKQRVETSSESPEEKKDPEGLQKPVGEVSEERATRSLWNLWTSLDPTGGNKVSCEMSNKEENDGDPLPPGQEAEGYALDKVVTWAKQEATVMNEIQPEDKMNEIQPEDKMNEIQPEDNTENTVVETLEEKEPQLASELPSSTSAKENMNYDTNPQIVLDESETSPKSSKEETTTSSELQQPEESKEVPPETMESTTDREQQSSPTVPWDEKQNAYNQEPERVSTEISKESDPQAPVVDSNPHGNPQDEDPVLTDDDKVVANVEPDQVEIRNKSPETGDDGNASKAEEKVENSTDDRSASTSSTNSSSSMIVEARQEKAVSYIEHCYLQGVWHLCDALDPCTTKDGTAFEEDDD